MTKKTQGRLVEKEETSLFFVECSDTVWGREKKRSKKEKEGRAGAEAGAGAGAGAEAGGVRETMDLYGWLWSSFCSQLLMFFSCSSLVLLQFFQFLFKFLFPLSSFLFPLSSLFPPFWEALHLLWELNSRILLCSNLLLLLLLLSLLLSPFPTFLPLPLPLPALLLSIYLIF